MDNLYDIHCHAVPGVDDGAASVQEGLEILRLEYMDGVRTIILTPHYRRGMFETGRGRVKEQFELLQSAAAEILPDMSLYLGCEFHSNMDMTDLLDESEYFRMAGSCYVLLEFSGGASRESMQERIYQAVSNGYVPIIAHAERYDILLKDPGLAEQLVRTGAEIQVNAESILGRAGRPIQKFCRQLMKYDLLTYVGSDAHNASDRPPRIGECAAWLEKKMGTDYALRILTRNPGEIIAAGQGA